MIEINKKTLFGYNQEEVEYYLNDLQKEYTQQLAAKRRKLREVLDKNNEIKNHINLVTNEKNKISVINKKNSKTVNLLIKEINGMEKNLANTKKEEEQKKLNEYTKLKQKVKEFNHYCDTLSLSYIELTAFIKKYRTEQ